MKCIYIHLVFVITILMTLNSCIIIDIPQEVTIDTNPFNNYDNEGNTQLDKGSELIIVIPDIQHYTCYTPNHKILESIIDRIIEVNHLGYKVKTVIQVGDVTETNSPNEWKVAKTVFDKLDGEKINYILTTGNHDYGNLGITDSRDTYFNDYFNFSSQLSFRKSYLDSCYENCFFETTIHGKTLQIISLEFGPRDAVLEWAKKNIDRNKMGLLVTHAYLYKDKERYNWKEFGLKQTVSPYMYAAYHQEFGSEKVNDGEEIWQKLVYPSENIQFVISGHKCDPDYIGNLITENVKKRDVLQMLFNTQDFPNGGDGWIQILEFKNDKKNMNIRTYSSIFNKWITDSRHQYTFTYN